jgi:membrane fusion protein (multidrug efflux system)
VAGKDNKAEMRPVTVGDWVGDDWHIVEGLQAGDRVVVEGGIKLSAGTLLNPKPVNPKPAPAAATASQ